MGGRKAGEEEEGEMRKRELNRARKRGNSQQKSSKRGRQTERAPMLILHVF